MITCEEHWKLMDGKDLVGIELELVEEHYQNCPVCREKMRVEEEEMWNDMLLLSGLDGTAAIVSADGRLRLVSKN